MLASALQIGAPLEAMRELMSRPGRDE